MYNFQSVICYTLEIIHPSFPAVLMHKRGDKSHLLITKLLLTQAESLDKRTVTSDVFILKISQKLTTLTNHLQKTTLRPQSGGGTRAATRSRLLTDVISVCRMNSWVNSPLRCSLNNLNPGQFISSVIAMTFV